MKTSHEKAVRVLSFVDSVFGEDLHAKRVLSLANAVNGCLHASALAVHAIGLGLAKAMLLQSKHAIKQVDRLVSNAGVDVWALFSRWVPFVVSSRTEIVVAMDWTEFADDKQSTLAINMITRHGRATPLVWMTVRQSDLKDNRNEHEYRLLDRLKETVPQGCGVTVLADRGFGDTKLYAYLRELGFEFIIRFRGNILVTDASGEAKTGNAWVPANGHAKLIKNAVVTNSKFRLPGVVVKREQRMKEAWCLAVSSAAVTAPAAIALYGRRFTIEETFRDGKDPRFGFGLLNSRIGNPARRDRVLLISAAAMALVTLLGAAGEATGLDMKFKANTSKKRQHSLFRQGIMYYDCLVGMRDEWLRPLVKKFEELLQEHGALREILGLI